MIRLGYVNTREKCLIRVIHQTGLRTFLQSIKSNPIQSTRITESKAGYLSD